MKKILALALSLVLLFVMAAPAMAAGGEDAVSPDAVCVNGNHSLEVASETTKIEKDTETQHKIVTTVYYVCVHCTYSTQATASSSSYPHSGGTAMTAVCNGITQLWRYSSCSSCGQTNYRKDKACPGRPHTGVCQWI